MSDTRMNRRELLQRVAWLMGGAISAPAVLGVLNGCSPKPSAGWHPLFLSQEEGAIVEEIAELILPRTDTPGARDVGVPAFIDVILKDAYPSEDQVRFVSGLKDFDDEAQRAHGKPFLELPQAQRLAFLQQAARCGCHCREDAAGRQRCPGGGTQATVRADDEGAHAAGILHVAGRRDAGAAVRPVPGGFQACIPIAEAGNGKTWATETSLRF